MAMSVDANDRDGSPLSEINTTPLIDMLLVLLIMFILTIPIQTHAVKITVPMPPPPSQLPPPQTLKNEITIDPADRIFWNGRQVDLATLRAYLFAAERYDPEPELHIQPDPQARYEVVDRVLAETRRAQVTRMGFVGNEQYRNF